MQFSFHCAECMLRMEMTRIRGQKDNAKKLACAKEFCAVLANAPEGVSAPVLVPQFDDVFDRYFSGEPDPQLALKRKSGEVMLERLPAIRSLVFAADDPLYAALQYSRAANYIDFASFGDQVDFGVLDTLLSDAAKAPLDPDEYRHFLSDLRSADSLLLIADNAGEIVLDRLVLEVLRARYPSLALTVCVRGGPSLNDALREDAEAAGIPALARLIDNGTRIGGMEPGYLSPESQEALDSSSLILAKGQANLESLLGCGKNIYYLFLCKCIRFQQMFDKPAMTGMFVNERRVRLADPTA